MDILLYILLTIIAILLILVILIQPGKGDMITSMGGLGGQFNTMFGSTKSKNILSQITWGLIGVLVAFTLIFNVFLVGDKKVSSVKAPTEGIKVNIPAPQVPAPAAPAPSGNPQPNQNQPTPKPAQ